MIGLRLVVGLFAAAVTSAAAQTSTSDELHAQGAQALTKAQLEALVVGARVTVVSPSGAARSWDQGARGSFIASMRSANRASRTLHGKGTAKVDENGVYCVHIEWPQAVEAWCRRIYSLDGSYYAVSDDAAQSPVFALGILRPNPDRLGAFSSFWYLARSLAR